MTDTNSHIKYANALLKACNEAEAKHVLKDLEHLAGLYKDEGFRNLISKVAFAEAEVLDKALTATFKSHVSEITMNLLVLLASGRKLMSVPKIADYFSKIYHESKGIVEITVKTAHKADKDMEDKIMKKLGDHHKKDVAVKFGHEPKLIGGMQVFERGYVTDYSVANYLETMRKALMK